MGSSYSAFQLQTAAEVRQGVIGLSRRLRAQRSAQSLSVSKLSVLGRLNRSGPATAGELAAAEHRLPQTLTRVFAELESEGLISRNRGPRDGRQAVVAITEAGRQSLAREVAQWDAWLASAIAEFSEVEQEVLRLGAQLLNRLASDEPAASTTDGTADHPSDPDL
ncbi:MarR family transcriptional regulator [Actinomadura meridiana]|uniref:MarR family transcriptional regulator n=1 Tax=Actinomadura meridiana TaxID=559626 RepID=A0ABP8CN76_9ACTN